MALVYFHLFFFVFPWLTASALAAKSVAKPGCNDTCGDVTIPYPFGIGESCSRDKRYSVDCNSSSSTPYLSALNNLEVLEIDFSYQTVTVNVPISRFCQGNGSRIFEFDLNVSPFLLDVDSNRFVFHGCGTASVFGKKNPLITRCSTNCLSRYSTSNQSNTEDCNGVNCCRINLSNYTREYRVEVEWDGLNGGCGYAFMQSTYYTSQYVQVFHNNSLVPVTLEWTIDSRILYGPRCQSYIFPLVNGEHEKIRVCDKCISVIEEGNPYLYGCQDTQECKRCKKRGGYCAQSDERTFKCYGDKGWTSLHESTRVMILVIGGIIVILILMACCFALYKVIKRLKENKKRKRFFKRNGGKLLEQQQATDEGLVDKTIHYPEKVLEKATDGFNENRILGRGGQGTVYKGMLTDGRIVAIKRSQLVDESQLKEFINEVIVLAQINHRNVVKLLGCCLETQVPLLVSEFISNGTLYDHLHDENNDYPISFKMRLQIATEVAGALSYLHSATSIPIYHRDIKTTNILLDEKYQAKIADFGASRLISVDQTHLTTAVIGTFGYLDPEYYISGQFSEKSDVYSFGVVLAELLTREIPISLIRFGEHRILARYFTSAMEEGRVTSILDENLLKEGTMDELLALANLTMQCLNSNGKNRPTMKEVASLLEGIKKSFVSISSVQTDIGKAKYDVGQEESFPVSYDDSTSTKSFDENILSHEKAKSSSK